MARRFTGGRLVIASHNPGKIDEIARLLAPFGVTVVAASDMGMDAPEESGTSFAENAAIKARAAVAASGLPALADDSGLVVPALGGAPGLHSARWAGPERDFGQAMARLHREIAGAGEIAGDDAGAGADNRGAYFLCALALCWPDGHCESVEGRVDGTLVWPPRGTRGFGYDPMFVPMGHDITFGEMDPDEKHAISHRADAFRKLAAACFAA